MALPPEPIEEILPNAVSVVEAEVTEVISTGQQSRVTPNPELRREATSVPMKVPSQVVKLKVTKVHRGPALLEVVVQKPEGAYALKAGNKGPFLLDAGKPQPAILGRYGPDTWNLARILKALGK